jgi:hypothetical protein
MRAVYAGLQAVAPQADIASDDVAERTHTWQLVERARVDREVAEDRSGLRGITPAGHVGAVLVINAREHELAEPLRQLHRAYAQAVREGEVPRARQELLESVLDSFVPKALGRSGSEEEPKTLAFEALRSHAQNGSRDRGPERGRSPAGTGFESRSDLV